MRRAGQNPTESEVQDMINKIDDGTASLNFEERQIVNSSEYTYKYTGMFMRSKPKSTFV